MSRRPRGAEQQFGSDSFLDVLANMVGILIILIVLAGLRVTRNPAPSQSAPQPLTAAPTLLVPSIETDEEDVVPPLAFAPEPAPEPEPQPLPPPSPTPLAAPPQLVLELEELQNERLKLTQELQRAGVLADQLQQKSKTVSELSAGQKALLAKQNRLVEQHRAKVVELEEKVNQSREALTGLLAEFEQVKSSRKPVIEVKHRVTPISQVVDGPEVHFRLAENRVSVVPLEALAERAKAQIERQKEWLARFQTHQGSVGPIEGYTMNYIVERQQLSVVDELRHGSGVFRLGVTMFKIVPEPDMESESYEQAIKTGSNFHQALQAAPERATFTFWVYPESFGMYRKFQAICHKEGLSVSARPLPTGMPITGSPNGSRSAGQ